MASLFGMRGRYHYFLAQPRTTPQWPHCRAMLSSSANGWWNKPPRHTNSCKGKTCAHTSPTPLRQTEVGKYLWSNKDENSCSTRQRNLRFLGNVRPNWYAAWKILVSISLSYNEMYVLWKFITWAFCIMLSIATQRKRCIFQPQTIMRWKTQSWCVKDAEGSFLENAKHYRQERDRFSKDCTVPWWHYHSANPASSIKT